LILYTSALLLGLASSLHCVSMCGPIVMAINSGSIINRILYSLGRITTYAVLGTAIGIISGGFQIAGLQKGLSISVGILMILSVFLANKIYIPNPMGGGIIQRKFNKIINRKSSSAQYFIGVFNGLLPCGMVYMALTASLASGSAFNGFLFMIFFGLGTVPSLYAISWATTRLKPIAVNNYRKLIPIMAVLLGGILILRGLELGIPYLSPVLES